MSRRYCRNSFLAVVMCCVFAVPALGKVTAVKAEREPIVVTSDSMVADKLGDTVTFIGDVVLKKEAMTVASDRMVVHYDAGSKRIRTIEALGNVVVTKDGRTAKSKQATYYSADEKVVLVGDAHIIEKENRIDGKKITLFMKNDRSIVESGNVLLYQDKNLKSYESRTGK